jgi:predicted O-methyltransferase YrrM
MSARTALVQYLKTAGLYRPAKAGYVKLSRWHADMEVWRNIPARATYMARYYRQRIQPAWSHLFSSRELSNFTYDLTDRGKIHIAHAVAIAAGCTPDQARGWIDELVNDEQLRSTIVDYVKDSSGRYVTDARAEYGRRLGWYALVRASHPRIVIETGVDKGLGSVVLCAALQRNAAEGFPGRYIGTDLNPSAGELLREPYADFGAIMYGDSLASLAKIEEPIDLFINDSDHSADYERREYELIASKLSPSAVIIGDNAHVTDELANFATRTGRRFIAIRELPKDHWYLGATMGIAF